MSVALVLNCCGQRCPQPIIQLARQIAEVSIGDTVRVLADDPAAAHDIPAWCRMRGQRFCGADLTGAIPAFHVQRCN
ncbi:MAG: preprotein translocase subunit TatB [Acidimicrobiales bacterium]|nr:MAG: preprotein translocase subunit TatB [Acidimicrobiales bacterium]